jgi:hypothetical protein
MPGFSKRESSMNDGMSKSGDSNDSYKDREDDDLSADEES